MKLESRILGRHNTVLGQELGLEVIQLGSKAMKAAMGNKNQPGHKI